MEQIFKKLKYLFFIIIVISCNTKKKDETDYSVDTSTNKSKIMFHNFPDTVKINTVVEGDIHYDIINDEYNKKMIDDRFLELLISTSINKELAEYDKVHDNLLLSFTDTIPTGKFHFPAVFEKTGRQTLNLVIRDHMFLKPDKNTPSDKVVLRKLDCSFSKDVYVIE